MKDAKQQPKNKQPSTLPKPPCFIKVMPHQPNPTERQWFKHTKRFGEIAWTRNKATRSIALLLLLACLASSTVQSARRFAPRIFTKSVKHELKSPDQGPTPRQMGDRDGYPSSLANWTKSVRNPTAPREAAEDDGSPRPRVVLETEVSRHPVSQEELRADSRRRGKRNAKSKLSPCAPPTPAPLCPVLFLILTLSPMYPFIHFYKLID